MINRSEPAEPPVELEVQNLSKAYGGEWALRDVNFTVRKGDIVALLGHSGSGKTTILRSIAGFIAPTTGKVIIKGDDVTNLPENKRGVGVVFQSYALFPHMTVWQNIAYGLRVRKKSKEFIQERVQRELDRVGLQDYSQRKPSQLSGGQQQRVAVARILAVEPSVVLFDEPFSNLDAMLRERLRHELRELQQRVGFTALFVTHDKQEALALADKIAVLEGGMLVQYGSPKEIYESPRTLSVASLLGRVNVLSFRRETNGLVRGELRLPYGARGIPEGAETSVLLRPERLRVFGDRAAVPSEMVSIPGQVSSIEYQGSFVLLSVRVAEGDQLMIESRDLAVVDEPNSLALGTPVYVGVPRNAIQILGHESESDSHQRAGETL